MSTNFYIKCRYCGQEIKHLGKISNDKFLSNMTAIEMINRISDLPHWENPSL